MSGMDRGVGQTDDAPLVTGPTIGQGLMVILVQTTVHARWSNLALSRLFVEIQHRLLKLGQINQHRRYVPCLPPLEILGLRPPDCSR